MLRKNLEQCDHHPGLRSWTCWRVLPLSRRGRWFSFCFHALAAFVVMFGLLGLCQFALRRLVWTFPPLSPKDSELFAARLLSEAQQFDTATPRGIVLPLYGSIAPLGFSLILELRRLQVTLPVEVPHCGDLGMELQLKMKQQDPLVRFYDVCELAANASVEDSVDRKLFCVDLEHCRYKFRGFDIKVLAVVYSRFQEVMLLDADTLFFQSPMTLWGTDKYKSTGTIFFHDRICLEYSFLAARSPFVGGQEGKAIGALHRFLSGFNVIPYHQFGVVGSRDPSLQNSKQLLGLDFSFHPSSILVNSHAWKLHTGHQMDSSLVLWNKARQPRATAILASFISLNGLPTVPSYGDKELFWIACELAETAYAFSDFAVGAIGTDLVAPGSSGDGVLCGDALQHFPEQTDAAKKSKADAEPLYMNSDYILKWGGATQPLYGTAARAAELYPGSFIDRKLPLSCPFDVTTMELSPAEAALLTQRLGIYNEVVAWIGEDWGAWWHPFA